MITRRRKVSGRLPVLAATFLVLAVAFMSACSGAGATTNVKVIVLGVDGLDHALTSELMEQGRLPNLQRLAEQGGFQPLGTSIPPQSPVAWSNFITGMDAGGHGIYDFVHRDPETMIPYLSTSRTEEAERAIELGSWKIPLSSSSVELLRHGVAFWEVLEARGIPSTIIRIPANFPPSGSAYRELSGMGTPDMLGTPGTYTFYTTQPGRISSSSATDARIVSVALIDGVFEGELAGPPNPLRVDEAELEVDFTVYVDPVRPVAKVVVGDSEVLLNRGEWSEWTPISFDLIPYVQSVGGQVRFYLKETQPEFELYVTPINIDPSSPAMPISTPEGYAAELAEATGPFYTQGMPEDTNVYNDGIFDVDDFISQARIAGSEIADQFEYVLDNFESGLLFYYFGNIDQVSHMMWRPMDPTHPAYDPEVDPAYADVIPGLYEEMDGLIGKAMERIGDDTLLIVMSDHGFTSFKRAFNLNTWLLEEGYIRLRNPRRRTGIPLFGNVDWSRTQAYALGLNGMYVNLQGRERFGTVPTSERDGLIEEIGQKLLSYRDPDTGEPAVTKYYVVDEVFEDRGQLAIGPDVIVGFAKGVRSDGESALGEFTDSVMYDNTDPWSGDHLMDHEAVPGVLFTSRSLKKRVPSLKELAGAILAEFGIEEFPVREPSPE